ncbi:MAG: hypothetical protein IH831_07110, partial [Planctomycetes bacterium]|nr:hypothetical protein [Planctomycetota bacterium]
LRVQLRTGSRFARPDGSGAGGLVITQDDLRPLPGQDDESLALVDIEGVAGVRDDTAGDFAGLQDRRRRIDQR